MNEEYIKIINEMCKLCYQEAVNKGFYTASKDVGTKIALMHSELSEALEAARHGFPRSQKISVGQFEEELADTIIRIFDYAGSLNLDLGRAIVEKFVYNSTRQYLHGKSF